MLGNPLPESCIVLSARYPRAENQTVPDDGKRFSQTPTLGGILWAIRHNSLEADVTTSSTRTADGKYFMPEILIKSSGFLQLQLDPINSLVWTKSYPNGRGAYQWVHETHAALPWEDLLEIDTRHNGMNEAYAALTIMLIGVLGFWSRGLVIISIVVVEPVLKRLQGWLVGRKISKR